MKKLLTVLVFMICLLSFSSLAFANSGSAVIPFYWSGLTYSTTWIYVSNITSSDINVKVTLYKDTGVILQGYTTSGGQIQDFQNNLMDCTLTFTLGPNKSGYFSINAPTTNGYGIIQWDQNSTNVKGLVAHGELSSNHNGEISEFAIPINEGLPF